jgi:hypothetical protein
MKTILVSACMLALISMGSCKKEGCTYVDATNYDMKANSDDGSCKFQAQDYVGTYNVTGYMVDQTFGDTTNQNYQLIITHTGETNISISNLGNTSTVFTATIKNNQLTLPSQDKNVVETWSGSGVITGNTINLQYNESFHDNFYNEVAVKQ